MKVADQITARNRGTHWQVYIASVYIGQIVKRMEGWRFVHAFGEAKQICTTPEECFAYVQRTYFAVNDIERNQL